MTIEIIQAGTFTTVQDGGRPNWAHLGVPISGFLDDKSAHLANWMVGNDANDALLEVTWTGVAFRSHVACSMSIAGAEFDCYLNDKKVNTDYTIQLKTGDYFKMVRLRQGVRAYLAFSGSFDLAEIAGSLSTLAVAELGGYLGRQLKSGDFLNLKSPALKIIKQKPEWKKLKSQSIHVIRAMPGPEFDGFKPAAIRQAFGQAYQLSDACNRQGFRLLSESIRSSKTFTMNSSGLVAGSLQVTPDGQTILAMKDAQTTGGYPRILVINQDQIHLMAQIRPGAKVYFYVAHKSSVAAQLMANYQ